MQGEGYGRVPRLCLTGILSITLTIHKQNCIVIQYRCLYYSPSKGYVIGRYWEKNDYGPVQNKRAKKTVKNDKEEKKGEKKQI